MRLREQKPVEEAERQRRKGSSQIHPEPVFPRVCQQETAVRRGLYLTNALYYSRPLGKSPVSVRLDEKDPDWIPPPLNRLGSCEQSHISSRHVTLWSPVRGCRQHQLWQQECRFWGCTEGPRAPRFEDHREAFFEASSQAPWWSVNKHL